MTDVTNYIRVLGLIVSVTRELSGFISESRGLIETAKNEGRDISDDELRDLREKSRSALDRWLDD